MTDANIHVGDIGTQLIAALYEDDVLLDPATATKLRYFIQRPDRTILEVTPTVITDTDSLKKCKYVSVSGDFNDSGFYILQVYAETAGGKWHTSDFTFEVKPNVRDAALT